MIWFSKRAVLKARGIAKVELSCARVLSFGPFTMLGRNIALSVVIRSVRADL